MYVYFKTIFKHFLIKFQQDGKIKSPNHRFDY